MTSIIVGIDPGLVHTGCVALYVDSLRKQWKVEHALVEMTLQPDGELAIGKAAADVARWVAPYDADLIVVEAYKPRSHFDTDANMGRLVNEIRRCIPRSKSLVNTGVKQVVRPPMMRALGLWNFSTPTHHQDLRSAARIGLYGALKEEDLNGDLYDLMVGVVDGTGWHQI